MADEAGRPAAAGDLDQERLALLAAERWAREHAEVLAARVVRLQAVTSALSGARASAEVAEIVITRALKGEGAAAGGLWLLDADGCRLSLAGGAGFEPGVDAAYRTLPLDAALPGPDVVQTGEPCYLRSKAERDARYPSLIGTPSAMEAIAILPLLVEGRAIGCLALSYPQERDFDEGKRTYLRALAEQCAQALERGRLYDAQRTATDRLAFLAMATELLTTSLDFEATMQRVVTLGIGVLGDMCVLDLLVDGVPRRVARAHADPAKQRILDTLLLDPDGGPAARGAYALSSGQPLLVDEVDDETLRLVALSEAHLAAARELDIGPSIVVPLVARGRTVGVLHVSSTRGSRVYGLSDLSLAVELARRAAVAIDNARLFAERTEIAQTLQRSLLPPRLPQVPGVEIAARYHPGHEGLEVGGDFYDVFAVNDGWALMIGDVVGAGPRAAARTALVRHTARAVAGRVAGPSEVVEVVHGALHDDDDDESFCTLIYAQMHLEGGVATLQMCNAGHPPAVVLRHDGRVEAIPVTGPLLGPFEQVDLAAATVLLAPGDLLLCVTDGVLDTRAPGTGPPVFFGETEWEQFLAGATGRTADDVATSLEEAVLRHGGGQSSDDVAILAVRVEPTPDR